MTTDRMLELRAKTGEIPDLEKQRLVTDCLIAGETGYKEAFRDRFEVNVRPGTLHGRFETAKVESITEEIKTLCRRVADLVFYRPELAIQMEYLQRTDRDMSRKRAPLGLNMTVGYMSNDMGTTVVARARAIFENFDSRFSTGAETRRIMDHLKTALPHEDQGRDALILEVRGHIPDGTVEVLQHYFDVRIKNAVVGRIKILDALQMACAKLADSSQPPETMVAYYNDNKNSDEHEIVICCNPETQTITLSEISKLPREQFIQPVLKNYIKLPIPLEYLTA